MAEFAYSHGHDFRYVGKLPNGFWECSLCGKCLPNEPSICDGEKIVQLFSEEGVLMLVKSIQVLAS